MTLVQTQPCSVRILPAVLADPGDGPAPRVGGDMTVEVALAVMAGARVGSLIVCDEDDQHTDSVTQAQLAMVRDGSAYTDRIRLRDVLRLRRAPGAFALSR
ncbi:CBS domain-containing protein [Streptomyces sp. NPDC018036]|uniref:CBS domain-containing protein n=1 Tax=Streptomyces sp. NPDC018036 TaxID=3365035 RepID=UPI003795DBE0